MKRLLLALALAASPAMVSAAPLQVQIASARVFTPSSTSRTVAVVRPESGSAEADRALEEGLRAAGLTVVAKDANPALLVSYVTDVRRVWGVYPNGAHAGTNVVPASSVNDNYMRVATVVAWDAGSARPTQGAVAWVTRLTSGGLSSQQSHFLPEMLRAGAKGYGRDLPRA